MLYYELGESFTLVFVPKSLRVHRSKFNVDNTSRKSFKSQEKTHENLFD